MLSGVALLTGCVSPKPMGLQGDEPFAVVYTKPIDCILVGSCAAPVTVRAINGKPVNNWSSPYNYKVDPGPVSVLVLLYSFGDGGVKGNYTGVCELSWTAAAGVLYRLDRSVAGDRFRATAASPDGSEAAECYAPFD